MFVWQHRYYESWSCCGDTDFMSKECAREKKAFENEKMDEQLAVKYVNPSYYTLHTPFIHPLYTSITIFTPMYTRYTRIYTPYVHGTPLLTPYMHPIYALHTSLHDDRYGDKKKRARPKGAPSEYVERLVNLNKARPKSARDPS